MITADRQPVNSDARRALSKGNPNGIESVEQALAAMGSRIASPEFGAFVRQLIEAGANVKYELTIKKSNQPGFVVSLDYQPEAPKKSCGVFLRLL